MNNPEELQRLVALGQEALRGNSNDAEHDALFHIVSSLEDELAKLQSATQADGVTGISQQFDCLVVENNDEDDRHVYIIPRKQIAEVYFHAPRKPGKADCSAQINTTGGDLVQLDKLTHTQIMQLRNIILS